jgi:hypothetical protein
VSFFAPRAFAVLGQLARILRPGGRLFAAFRSQWFNLVHSLLVRDLDSARLVRDARDGRLWGGGHRFWWHTPLDIERALASAGLTLDGPCRGIGILSALTIDRSNLPAPSSLDDRDRAALLDLELSLAEAYAAQGRYIVAVARK